MSHVPSCITSFIVVCYGFSVDSTPLAQNHPDFDIGVASPFDNIRNKHMLISFFFFKKKHSSIVVLFCCPSNFTNSAISILTREREFSTETVRIYHLVSP